MSGSSALAEGGAGSKGLRVGEGYGGRASHRHSLPGEGRRGTTWGALAGRKEEETRILSSVSNSSFASYYKALMMTPSLLD